MADPAEQSKDRTDEDSDVSLWDVTKSVLWAFLGVQKDTVRRRDMSRGKPIHFIVIGLVATLIFILTLAGVVSLVMNLAQG